MTQPPTIVAYPGSAAAATAVRSLAQQAASEVVTLTVDLGQGGVAYARDRALAAGAARAHVLDAREELARAYALPALRAGVPEGGWLALIRTLGRPLVAEKLRAIAAIEGVDDAPAAHTHDVNASILGRVVEDGRYVLTRNPETAPDAPAMVAITFEDGVPVAINDVAMPLTELLESLTLIAGQHGVGRIEQVEAPAAVVLHEALRVSTGGVVRMKLRRGTCERAPELVSSAR